MTTNPPLGRTTAGLIGDLLASLPARQSVVVKNLAEHLQRDRGGVTDAVNRLQKAKAITTELDPEDRRRSIAFMTNEQREAWLKDAGAAVAKASGISLNIAPAAAKAAAATNAAAAQRRAAYLRFGLWSDGAIAIEGLARKQLTLPAEDTSALAQLFASFPEGALQALCESPLKPTFVLHIDGRECPLTSEQTSELVAYIEALPARAIRAPHVPDNRVHRLTTPEDDQP